MKNLAPFIVIIVCVTMYYMYISPLTTDVSKLIAQKNQYSDVLTKAEEIKAKREDVSAKYSSISPDNINKLGRLIPDTFDAILFLNDISAIAARYNMSIRDFRSNSAVTATRGDSDVVSDAPFQVVTVGFAVTGTYDQFKKFISEVESSLRLMDISTLNITPELSVATGKTGADAYNYSLEVKTYSLK
ncbi:MAG: type 4a pilus biogenesis protein PilO [Nitrospira sp.]